nr:unnamed protein product [Bos taurus]
GDPSLSSSLD